MAHIRRDKHVLDLLFGITIDVELGCDCNPKSVLPEL